MKMAETQGLGTTAWVRERVQAQAKVLEQAQARALA